MRSVVSAVFGGEECRLGSRGSFLGRFNVAKWSWSVSINKFGDDLEVHLHLFCLWVLLWRSATDISGEIMDSWGASYYRDESTLHLNWGSKYKLIYMPWMMDHCQTEVLLNNGSFVPHEKYTTKGGFKENPEPVGMYRMAVPYKYRLKNGTVQNVTATVTGERRTWCWRGWPFRWMRWPSMSITSIDVQFSDEVGERSGSWKGGCIGCGYELKSSETPEQCLRRMEAERVFD